MPETSRKPGRYRVIREVGAGGLGKVYEGYDLRNKIPVAIKVIHEKFLNDKKILGIFHRELLIMSRFDHKHLVRYMDSFFDPPKCFIVSEFIEGWSGSTFNKKLGKLPPLIAVSITFDMLQGIDYLHLHDTIHSDLSSANYLIEKTGRVVVADFGLAIQQEVEDYKDFRIGTPGYYSPEHISHTALIPQSDIFCTGLLLYEMLTGKKAVPGVKDRKEIMSYMKGIDLNLVRSSDKGLQKKLQRLVKTALQINPNKRFNSAEEMIYSCFDILKTYNIKYTKHAVRQLLASHGVVPKPEKLQNILFGFLK